MPFYSQYTPSEEKFFPDRRPKMPVSAAQFQRRRPWANRGTLIVAASSPGITNRHSKRGWFAGGTNKNVMCLFGRYLYLSPG